MAEDRDVNEIAETGASGGERVARIEGILEQVLERFNHVGQRMDRLEQRMDSLQQSLEARFQGLDTRLNWLTGIVITTWITLMVTILLKL